MCVEKNTFSAGVAWKAESEEELRDEDAWVDRPWLACTDESGNVETLALTGTCDVDEACDEGNDERSWYMLEELRDEDASVDRPWLACNDESGTVVILPLTGMRVVDEACDEGNAERSWYMLNRWLLNWT